MQGLNAHGRGFYLQAKVDGETYDDDRGGSDAAHSHGCVDDSTLDLKRWGPKGPLLIFNLHLTAAPMMTEQVSADLSPGLLRQRRNLMLMSLLLFAKEFAQLELTGLSAQGVGLAIGDTKNLILMAWVIWAYFLVRYAWYHHSDVGILCRVLFDQQFKQYVAPIVEEHFEQKYVADIEALGGIANSGFVIVEKQPSDEYKSVIIKYSVHWISGSTNRSFGDVGEVGIPRDQYAILKNGALHEVFLRRPTLTDYYLPYVVAVLPVIALLAK